MICDEDYVMPTCVALHSLIAHKDPETKLHIHIVTSNISPKNRERLQAFDREDVTTNIIAKDADALFSNYHEFKEGAMCVASLAALFKFMLPDLLEGLDKVLYLDGDIIVRKPLEELYATDIAGYYAAAIIDSGRLYFPTPWNQRFPAYFNSGVMLLNLEKLRQENVPAILLKTKMELEDASLMDQNVFNIVFENKVRLLPNRYNLMAVNLTRTKKGWKIEDLNELYHSSYRNKNELYKDAVIVHYSSKDKPWKDRDNALSDLWIDEYLETSNIDHDLYKEEQSKPLSIITDLRIDGLKEQNEAYEVFSFRKHDSSIENILEKARGDYFWFIEHDIILKENTLETIRKKTTRNALDALVFEEEHEAFAQVYPKAYDGGELLQLLQKNEEELPGFDRFVIRRDLLERYMKDHKLLREDILYQAQRIRNHNEALYAKQSPIKAFFKGIRKGNRHGISET